TLDDSLPLDPFIISLASGGRVQASTVDPACTGYVAAAPDYRLTWGGSGTTLRFLFAGHGEGDATLLISGPDGAITCNDDGFGLNPLVEFANPAAGVYNIWVG